MKTVILSVVCALIVGACCRHQYFEDANLIKEVIKRDTLILIPQAKLDTLTLIDVRKQTDTFLIEKERLRVQVVRVKDTLKIEGECKADTVRVPVEIEKILYLPEKQKPNNVGWWAFGAGLLLALCVWGAGKFLF